MCGESREIILETGNRTVEIGQPYTVSEDHTDVNGHASPLRGLTVTPVELDIPFMSDVLVYIHATDVELTNRYNAAYPNFCGSDPNYTVEDIREHFGEYDPDEFEWQPPAGTNPLYAEIDAGSLILS
jgi:hypothetical protein